MKIDLSDVHAYLHRDWSAQYAEAGAQTPLGRLQAISAACAQIRAAKPEWPGENARQDDLATHILVSRLLRDADPR